MNNERMQDIIINNMQDISVQLWFAIREAKDAGIINEADFRKLYAAWKTIEDIAWN